MKIFFVLTPALLLSLPALAASKEEAYFARRKAKFEAEERNEFARNARDWAEHWARGYGARIVSPKNFAPRGYGHYKVILSNGYGCNVVFSPMQELNRMDCY